MRRGRRTPGLPWYPGDRRAWVDFRTGRRFASRRQAFWSLPGRLLTRVTASQACCARRWSRVGAGPSLIAGPRSPAPHPPKGAAAPATPPPAAASATPRRNSVSQSAPRSGCGGHRHPAGPDRQAVRKQRPVAGARGLPVSARSAPARARCAPPPAGPGGVPDAVPPIGLREAGPAAARRCRSPRAGRMARGAEGLRRRRRSAPRPHGPAMRAGPFRRGWSGLLKHRADDLLPARPAGGEGAFRLCADVTRCRDKTGGGIFGKGLTSAKSWVQARPP